MSVFWKRHWALLVVLAGLIIVFWLGFVLRGVLLPFYLGGVIAYLVLPLINWIEERLPAPGRWRTAKRVFLIIFIFFTFLALTVAFSYYIVTRVSDGVGQLIQNAPQYITDGIEFLQNWTQQLRDQFPPQFQQQIDSLIMNLGVTVGQALQRAFTGGIVMVTGTFSFVLGLAALPLFLFYLLKDSKKLRVGFYAGLPSLLSEHIRNIIGIFDRVLGQYLRAQVTLGIVVAVLAFIGLSILRVPLTPALALVAGLTELIPFFGPWIGGTIAVLVTLAISPDKALWVAVVFLVVQLAENTLLVPRIHSGYLHIHPVVLAVVLVLGSYLAGFWGILLAAPLTAVIVALYKYVNQAISGTVTKESLPPF